MATQTAGATENITKLIQNMAQAIEEVVSVIYKMIDGINEEKLYIIINKCLKCFPCS